MSSTNASALPIEEAAEIGAQYLWDMFQIDLEGKTIYMSHFVDPSVAKAYWKVAHIIETGSEIWNGPPTSGFVIRIYLVKGNSDFKSNTEERQQLYLLTIKSYRKEYSKNNCDEYFLTVGKAIY